MINPRLQIILNESKIQSTNNALYQVIKNLIDVNQEQQNIIDQLTAVTGIDAIVDAAGLATKTATFTDGKLVKFI